MSMNVSAWTTEDLCAWLTENQLEAACSSFRDNELDGEELFNLTDDMIKTLFPTMKSQLRFIRARKDLREESSANAAEPEALPLIVELGSTQDPPTDTWPSVYKLPPFPPALQRGLVEKDRSLFKPGQSRLRTMLVRALAEDITKYSLYPSKTQYSDVFATLGARYPFLKDKDTGRCDTIRQCVQNKLKKERRPLVSLREVTDYRNKYGTKGRGRKRSAEHDIAGPSAKACRRGSISSNKCEDEASIRHHIAVMKEETAKVAADMDLIRDRMKRTFKTRQDLILRETGVRTVIEEFPAVTLPGMLLQDAKLAFGKDFLEDMRTKMKTFEVSTLLFLKGKNSPLDFQELIEEDPEKVALFNLPLIFNEKRQLLFTTEEVRILTPVIQVEEKNHHIFLDGVRIVSGISTTVEAVSTLLAAYYVFDVNFSRSFAGHFKPPRENKSKTLTRADTSQLTPILMPPIAAVSGVHDFDYMCRLGKKFPRETRGGIPN
ncbi:uncharacterized protein ISCGN_015820 [Ixodes scapularis]